MDNRPVGVFDSGVGGTCVLRTLTEVLPLEKYIYYGDTKNAPYGDRPEAQIRSLVLAVADHLVQQGVKALVIACNTATSAAAEALRARLTIPVVGMEPALKPASLEHKKGTVLVMATSATLRQQKFQSLMQRYGEGARLLPCPGLMEFAERGEVDGPALDLYLEEKFAPYRGEAIDAVVLGCTHYVFLKKAIQRQAPGALLFDGNLGTARRLESLLKKADALGEGPGELSFESSDPASIPVIIDMFGLSSEKNK